MQFGLKSELRKFLADVFKRYIYIYFFYFNVTHIIRMVFTVLWSLHSSTL